MTNDERNLNVECLNCHVDTIPSGLGDSSFFRHSSFVIRHSQWTPARLCVLVISWCLILSLWPLICGAQAPRFGTDTVEDRPEKLEPRTARTEQDDDRLFAAAQYALGRMLQQRDDAAGSLRHFQRAYRRDPGATMIVRDIVPLASSLGRHAEAARYAILGAEHGSGDAGLLRQLGEILVEQGDVQRALRMFEQALLLSADKDAREPSLVLLQAEMGRLYLLTEKVDLAAESLTILREALANAEQFGFTGEAKQKLLAQRERLYPLIGESFLRVKRFDDAAAMFRLAHEVKPNEQVLAFQLARLALEQSDWTAAREHLEKYFAAKTAAAGAAPYELLARVLAGELGDSQKAATELVVRLSQLHELDSQNVALAYFLAGKLIDAGQLDRAAQLYSELLAREPTATAYRALARIYREKKDASAFIKLLGEAIEKGGSRDVLDDEYEAVTKDTTFFNQLLELARAPAGEEAVYGRYLGMALIAITAGKSDIVEELYEKALTQSKSQTKTPTHKTHDRLGVALLLADQHQLAQKVFARAIADSPPKDRIAVYHFYLAGAHELAGNQDAALVAAEKCAELDPASAQFCARPAWVLYHAKRFADAQQRYSALLAKFDSQYDNEETRDQMRQARLALSNICVFENRLPEAEEWLEQVLDEFPEDVGAQNDLGYLWADQGKHLNRALAMCQHAVTGEPENGAYRDSLGWAYYRVGRYAEATRELEKAASLSADGVIFDHLGDAYLKANELDKAIDAWQRAIAAFTKDQDSEKLNQTKAKLEQYKK